jgi:hypothetical protein
LYFVHGLLLQSRKRFAEARVKLHAAARTAAIGKIRRSALWRAIVCDVELALATGKPVDPAMLRECHRTIREVLKMGPIRDYEEVIFLKVAEVVDDRDLVRQIVTAWERAGKGDTVLSLQARMKLEADTGCPILALRAAERLLKKEPSNVQAVRIRAESIAAIKKLAAEFK